MKLIVTGGAGFIGSNLVDALVNTYHDDEVHVIDNLSNGKVENVNKKAILHVADITDINQIFHLFAGADYVFHLAALPRIQYSIDYPASSHKVNVDGTVNVLIAAWAANAKRVIYSSSSSVYGDQMELPLKESLPARPKSPYGLQKYVGELYCQQWSEIYGLQTVCLRYFNVYGKRQSDEGAYALVIAKFMKQKAMDEPMTICGDGTQTRDFTNVKDVVNANIMAMKSSRIGNGEAINIGGGHNVSVNRIAELIRGRTTFIDPREEVHDTLADNSLAWEFLRWRPLVTIEEGIEELLKI